MDLKQEGSDRTNTIKSPHAFGRDARCLRTDKVTLHSDVLEVMLTTSRKIVEVG